MPSRSIPHDGGRPGRGRARPETRSPTSAVAAFAGQSTATERAERTRRHERTEVARPSRAESDQSPTEAASKPVQTCRPTGTKLRPRRRRKVRLRYLMQAWSVSLVVHVVILSALAAATFTARSGQEDPQLRLGAGGLPQRRARRCCRSMPTRTTSPAIMPSATSMRPRRASRHHGRDGATARVMTAVARSPAARAPDRRRTRRVRGAGKGGSTKERACPASRSTGWEGLP